MADYKYSVDINSENYGVIRLSDGASIPPDTRNSDWREYLEYVDTGGKTDPWKTDEELKEMAINEKLMELKIEYDRRIDIANGSSDVREVNKERMKQFKLLRKEFKGSASVDDVNDLDQYDVINDHLDTLEREHDTAEKYIEDPVRTIEEIETYDVVNDPAWSTM